MSATQDVFGINKIYKDKSGGPQWDAMHWNKGGKRIISSGYKDPYDPTGCSENRGNVTWTIDGDGMLIFKGTKSGRTEPRFHLNKPSKYFFQDAECTFYMMRVKDDNTNWGGANIGVRSGPNGHSYSSEYCDAHTYYQRFRNDGKMDFEKELKHPKSSAKQSRNIWNGNRLPHNKWIGYKSVTRNAGNGVKLQLFIDLTDGANGGTWVKLGEERDTGGWAPPQSTPKCSYAPDFIPLTGGGVIVLRNTGCTDCRYKWMSVREIRSSYANPPEAEQLYGVVDDDMTPTDSKEIISKCTTEEVKESTQECINCNDGECSVETSSSWWDWVPSFLSRD